MGQTTIALVLGISADSKTLDDKKWEFLHKEEDVCCLEKVIGLPVIVGAGGHDGCPSFDSALPCDENGAVDLQSVPEYQASYECARIRWDKISWAAKKQGIHFDKPRLWFVEMEVA